MSNISLSEYREVIKDTFDYEDFKSEDQRKAVEIVMSGAKNILISMATQAGKTLCFQIPSSFQRDGIILVITPSISLISNQTSKLNKFRLPATSITSVLPEAKRKEILRELEDYKNTPYRFIYMTPEMIIQGGLKTREVISTLMAKNQISHVVVDEAHCAIDKAIDFRSAFTSLKFIREKYPQIRWIALTTASIQKLQEIARFLSMREPTIFKSLSDRKNIFYDVISSDEAQPNFRKIVEDFLELDEEKDEFITKRTHASGIIFCATNAQADIIADGLSEEGVSAKSYYGSKNDVNLIQKQWKDGLFPVIVATTESFGFGINRTPLTFIVHFSFSKNLRGFYQESGRVDAEKYYSRIYINKHFSGSLASEEMKNYVETKSCRHQFLANFFGDEEIEICINMCDNCEVSATRRVD